MVKERQTVVNGSFKNSTSVVNKKERVLRNEFFPQF